MLVPLLHGAACSAAVTFTLMFKTRGFVRSTLAIYLLLLALLTTSCGDIVAQEAECADRSDCDLSLSCVEAACVANRCVFTPLPGRCFIDGACYNDGEKRPIDSCLECSAGASQVSWDNVCQGPDAGDIAGSETVADTLSDSGPDADDADDAATDAGNELGVQDTAADYTADPGLETTTDTPPSDLAEDTGPDTVTDTPDDTTVVDDAGDIQVDVTGDVAADVEPEVDVVVDVGQTSVCPVFEDHFDDGALHSLWTTNYGDQISEDGGELTINVTAAPDDEFVRANLKPESFGVGTRATVQVSDLGMTPVRFMLWIQAPGDNEVMFAAHSDSFKVLRRVNGAYETLKETPYTPEGDTWLRFEVTALDSVLLETSTDGSTFDTLATVAIPFALTDAKVALVGYNFDPLPADDKITIESFLLECGQ